MTFNPKGKEVHKGYIGIGAEADLCLQDTDQSNDTMTCVKPQNPTTDIEITLPDVDGTLATIDDIKKYAFFLGM